MKRTEQEEYEVTLYVSLEAKSHREAGLLIMRQLRDAEMTDYALFDITDGKDRRSAAALELDLAPDELDYREIE